YVLNKKTWYNYQPRIKIQYKPTKNDNLTLTYDKTFQNLHILTMSSSIVPADIWVPATEIAKPENAHQFSIGYSHSFNRKYELTVSGFYKIINNLIDYKRHFYITDTVINPTWEQQIVTNGTGTIYGLEFLAEKNTGKFTGWISYTYMKNYRKFEDLNNGEPFAFNYDRRHNLKLVAQYNFNDNLSLNAVFMFGSGYPLSLSVIKQNFVELIEGENANTGNYGTIVDENTNYYSELNFEGTTYVFNKINSYRMPAYHRLDISLNWEKQKKRGIRTWTFGIYNVYNQQNAYFLFLAHDTPEFSDPNVEYPVALYKFTLFPIIPSISYNFKF
ncbi:MAG: TonB-dependent receptor, partial [Bacteroidales bacterium]|nr:TonB-dependent receptor [Bacteroidales bacterium]